MGRTLASLEKRLETERLSKQAREVLVEEIEQLKVSIERHMPSDDSGESLSDKLRYRWDG